MSANFTTLLQSLTALASPSSDDPKDDFSNENVIDYLCKTLEPLGFVCHKTKVKNSRNKFNLKATLGSGPKGLAFSGHTDTVPADKSLWLSDPYTLKEAADRYYGLGVIDMKGFFAHVIDAIQNTDLKNLKHPIHILATADEETTMSGAIALAQEEMAKQARNTQDCMRPDLICIGEPTSLVPVIMHKGQIVIRVDVSGQSGHSSNPDAGLNAIKIMGEVINALNAFEDELRTEVNPLFPVDHPTLNIGQIFGGDAPNRICDACTLIFDIRLMPGCTQDTMFKRVTQHLTPLMNKYDKHILLSIPYDPVEAFGGQINPETISYLEELTSHKAQAVNYATEATYFQNLAPTVILGAGDIANAHQPNEYLLKSEVPLIGKIYKNLIKKYCLQQIEFDLS